MTDNIIEKGKAPDKAAEDTVMTTKPMTTEEGAREPPKRWKKSQAYFERSRALAREKYRKRPARRRLRKVGIEVPPHERDPALPLQPKRNKRHRTKKRTRKEEKAVLAAVRPKQEPSADTSVHPATTTHPGHLEVNTLSSDDEQMGGEHVETGFRPVSLTLPFRGKPST
ncbi:hypothetical protein N7530_003327 [Penicillium desertorum]|uniref:Uncharacterized protein n=1 Tax=Penicillium desertorum TaxID=1303715 RepID=A0A9X0BPG5_9EURO|nr:hypothetical protein N7530_003327 [Penicillium desertorum]